MQTVLTQQDYPVEAGRLWALVTDHAALRQVIGRGAHFYTHQQGRIAAGETLELTVPLFGVIPWRRYRLEVVECDDSRMILRSAERGRGLRGWRHTMAVTRTSKGCRLTDRIEIDAGILTPLSALWARHFSLLWHGRRQALLDQGAF